jgi:hypothetical protein
MSMSANIRPISDGICNEPKNWKALCRDQTVGLAKMGFMHVMGAGLGLRL